MHITSCTGHMRRSSIVIFCPTIPPPVTASELMTVVECSDKIPHSETIAITRANAFQPINSASNWARRILCQLIAPRPSGSKYAA